MHWFALSNLWTNKTQTCHTNSWTTNHKQFFAPYWQFIPVSAAFLVGKKEWMLKFIWRLTQARLAECSQIFGCPLIPNRHPIRERDKIWWYNSYSPFYISFLEFHWRLCLRNVNVYINLEWLIGMLMEIMLSLLRRYFWFFICIL